ncbi:peptidylprolyl isomerase [Coxiella burnetii]|uniref:Peptidyl-prolyl cis-trans isomerase n=1 Tax=Coxiella burnetii (strain Dugway 5J108-111) TaxID=434922 RepID=A9KGZ6_COXBN|nr:SurA N-terminal domain-containing protein [Coxiella burnetii]ABS77171.1 peptidyl-prolyl cis-trans isomerase [Coxiella burnetii Dugway 5J108-111]OYK79540.1 peptidylprolyl isomerase [Coxiella burnetii]OYK81621.1 peptidylprolyl isomerase [Coxiella burnetii]
MWKKILTSMVIILSVTSISAFAQSTLPAPNATHEQSLDQIVAVVNDEIITQSELNHALTAAKQQFMQRQISLPDQKTFKKQVLDQLIYQKLQLQVAKHNQIKVTNNEINAAVARISQANHLSQTALKQKLTQEGISYKEFRSQLQKQLIISKLQHQALQDTISINKSDIAAFQKQHAGQIASTEYHIATILIPLPASATQAQINHAKGKAALVLKQLQKGSSFETAMKMHPGSADLGWRSAKELPQVFVKTVLKMKPNEVTGPIQAPNGFHIIKLLDKEAKNTVSDQQIQRIVYQQKVEKALQKWLTQLRSSAYIHIYADS